MKRALNLFLIFIPFLLMSRPVEYLYPVGTISSESVLCIHQDLSRKLHVVLYHISSQQYSSMLSSQFNPIEVQLLPDGTGFSFIDNGVIKVKSFNKRSPRTIEIYEPLYAIANMQWINNQVCVFQAKRTELYGIYMTDLEGVVQKLASFDTCNAMYPWIVDDYLFFIKTDKHGACSLVRRKLGDTLDELILESKVPLAYIFMVEANRGYVLSYEYANLEEISCSILSCQYSSQSWMASKLYSINIPQSLFFDNNVALCENLRVFRPKNQNGVEFLPLFSADQEFDLKLVRASNLLSLRQKYSRLFSGTGISSCSGSNTLFYFGTPILVGDRLVVGQALA